MEETGGNSISTKPIHFSYGSYYWGCSLIFYGLINFVFDKGNIFEIQTEMLPNFSSLNKPIPIWVSSMLMSLPDVRKVIKTTSNLEDKVVSQGGDSDRTPRSMGQVKLDQAPSVGV